MTRKEMIDALLLDDVRGAEDGTFGDDGVGPGYDRGGADGSSVA